MLTSSQNSESDLIHRAKDGEFSAFAELARLSENRVYGLAMRLLQNHHDAQDITQQTFLTALEALPDFRGEASFATWLLRIAARASMKLLRKRRAFVSLEAISEGDEERGLIPHPEFIADWRESPEELANRREVSLLIEDALSQLDDKQRIIFILRDVEGFSVAETAELAGISEANVKVRLLRARLRLRETLTRVLGRQPDELREVVSG